MSVHRITCFVAKHQRLCRILVSLPWIVCMGLMIEIGLHYVVVGILGFMGLFFCFLRIATSASRLLKEPMERLNQQCDPYPLLQETTEQLRYRCSPADRQIRQINYAVALRQIGDYAQAEMVLRSINIDKYVMAPILKVLYYNNLMDICVLVGKHQEARVWYEKLMQVFADVKEGKQKAIFADAIAVNRAWYCYAGGNYAEALQILETVPPKKPVEQIDTAMMCARIYIAQNQRQLAVQALQFVQQHGNKLYAVQQARQMLTQLQKNEEN